MAASGSSQRRGGISDESVLRFRARLGAPELRPRLPHFRAPAEDVFRQLAQSFGVGSGRAWT